MKKIRFEVIRDDENSVIGYKLGNHYLMKHYTWMNQYSWIINNDGAVHYFDHEFWQKVDSGDVEICLSCKQGKQRLIELAQLA